MSKEKSSTPSDDYTDREDDNKNNNINNNNNSNMESRIKIYGGVRIGFSRWSFWKCFRG